MKDFGRMKNTETFAITTISQFILVFRDSSSAAVWKLQFSFLGSQKLWFPTHAPEDEESRREIYADADELKPKTSAKLPGNLRGAEFPEKL